VPGMPSGRRNGDQAESSTVRPRRPDASPSGASSPVGWRPAEGPSPRRRGEPAAAFESRPWIRTICRSGGEPRAPLPPPCDRTDHPRAGGGTVITKGTIPAQAGEPETFSQAISRCSIAPSIIRGGGIRFISPFSNRTPGLFRSDPVWVGRRTDNPADGFWVCSAASEAIARDNGGRLRCMPTCPLRGVITIIGPHCAPISDNVVVTPKAEQMRCRPTGPTR
jgi:hypothetical protein